ncbi:MAG: thioredoxin [Muribaculaceae bacterium]|nr:thioredoxin [Muribaculaceae bacterium]
MRNSVLTIITMLLFLVSCAGSEKTEIAADPDKTCVEILYFHGDMRCRNCYAMEKGVAELLDDEFKQEVKDGKIIFKTIDITTEEGERVADNYGVTWSSLFLNNWKDGKEERNDLTRMGMSTAAKDPETFKAEVKKHITNYLND